MNSKSSRHPNGLANNSDVVGRYLHDSTGADMTVSFPIYSTEKDIMKMA
ncbi:MAG: hypothetical protein WDM78_04185 [Puia sp.]